MLASRNHFESIPRVKDGLHKNKLLAKLSEQSASEASNLATIQTWGRRISERISLVGEKRSTKINFLRFQIVIAR